MEARDFAQLNLKVFVTYFVPPEPSICTRIQDFLVPRLSLNYVKSYFRFIRYRKWGSTPWRTDIMTKARRRVESQRFFYLNNLIASFFKMPVRDVVIHVHTNSPPAARDISRIWKSRSVRTHVHEKYNRMNYFNNSPWQKNANSPWLLTWEHKESLLNEVSIGSEDDIFICIEDDALFSFDNLVYFLKYKPHLAKLGLIPSFLRTEWSQVNQDFVAIDRWEPLAKIKLSSVSQIKTRDGQLFVELPNPYSGIIILDHQLALEYVSSKAFNEESSRDLTWWDIGARAAMGLQFVNVPEGFSSRNVVPVTPDLSGIEPFAWVAHQPNLYANKIFFPKGLSPHSMFDKP